jgi:Secretion system C-terminal sorting domain/SprB repeat
MKNIIVEKKSKLGIFVLLLFILQNNLVVNAATTFQKTFGGTSDEYGYATEQLSDGGYIMCGRTISFGVGGFDNYLIRLNANGDTLWTKTYGNTGYDEAQSIKQTSDGGFIMVGQTATVDYAGDVYLVKTDANGVLVWSTAFGSATKFDFGYSVRQTSDGGYIIAGLTNSTGAGLRDVLLLKTNATGVLQWSKTYGGAADDEARSVEETADGGFIISGFTQSYGSGYQMYLIKTNSTGNVTWSKTFGGGGLELGYSVKQTSDGGYVLLGYSDSYGSGLVDVLLLKLTATGGISWSKTYGGTADDYGLCIHITTDGGYIISGRTSSYGAGAGDYYLIKTDVNGVHQWSKAYGGSAVDQAGNVRQTADGGYILTGYTLSFGAGIREAYLVKTDAVGASGCNEFTTTTQTTSATVANSTGATEGLGLSAVSPVTATRRVKPVVTTSCSSSACTLTIAAFAQTNVTCNGSTNGTASISSTGGVGTLTYNWTPGNPTGDGTASVTNLSAGSYSCTVTDANGCTASQTVTITQPNVLVSTITSQTNVSCFAGTNGAASILVSGGTTAYSYNWTPGNPTGDGTANVTGLTAGTWTCTITDANGCTASQSVTITQAAAINNAQNISICAGQTLVIGTNSYATSGIYTDVLAAINGCDSTVTTNLTVNPLIDLTTTTSGNSITANTSPADYQWIDCNNGNSILVGAISQVYTSTANGNYAVIISQNGCSDTSACVTITTTGIVLKPNNEDIQIFPNPTASTITLKGLSADGNIIIMNALGQTIFSTTVNQKDIEKIIDLSDLKNGMYYILIENKDKSISRKIIKE